MGKKIKDKTQIEAWLQKHKVRNFDVVQHLKTGDWVVNVQGHVQLAHLDLIHLPVQFHRVSGSFICNHNPLTNLKGCPETVGGDFFCDYNQLTSLKYCPKEIGGVFIVITIN